MAVYLLRNKERLLTGPAQSFLHCRNIFPAERLSVGGGLPLLCGTAVAYLRFHHYKRRSLLIALGLLNGAAYGVQVVAVFNYYGLEAQRLHS